LTFPSIASSLKGAHATDVTGGMEHKVRALLSLAQTGIASLIINGNQPEILQKAILGEEVVGTIIQNG